MRLHAAAALALLPVTAFALPRGVTPVHRTPALVRDLAAAAPSNAHLNYYGGHVVSNPHVVPVMWGSNVPSDVSGGVADFYSAALDSGYMDFLAEYNTTILDYDGNAGTNQSIGRGTSEAARVIKPSITSTSITDDQIRSELQAQIRAGNLPANDANTIYMIHFPAGMSISMPDGSGGTAKSCQQFCAYHNTIQSSPTNIFYGVIPNVTTDGCELGCGPIGGGFNNTTSVASHELIETTTDAEVGLATTNGPPLGWYDPQGSNGEIGDICNADQGTITSHNKTWTVQKEWSNTQDACTADVAADDFALVASPGHVNVSAGSTAKFTLVSTVTNGAPGTIALSAGSLPAGVTVSFAATSLAPGQSTQVTVSASASATNGDQLVEVLGNAGGTQRHAKFFATISGAQTGGGGGGGCPAGTISIGGVCVPTGGCSTTTTGAPSGAWVSLLALGGVLFALRRRKV